MADMIEAKDAKARLSCDDATLQNHINSGALRAQRVGGKLMLNADDVSNLAKDDDGTIVLTGDSENLSIDLGKVVDDQAATMVKGKDDSRKDDSITFGDELEVVSYDDGNTKQLKTDTKATGQARALSFTDTNTAVITGVDETQVGATTGINDTIDSVPSQYEIDSANRGSDSSRRSVRSTRMRSEPIKVHWAWVVIMSLTLLIGVVFTVPYFAMSMWAKGGKDNAGNIQRGLDDGTFAQWAGSQWFAGFSVEPNKKMFKDRNRDGEWNDIKSGSYKENEAAWRLESAIGGNPDETDSAKKIADFVSSNTVVSLSADQTTGTTQNGKTVRMKKVKVKMGDRETEEIVPVLDQQ